MLLPVTPPFLSLVPPSLHLLQQQLIYIRPVCFKADWDVAGGSTAGKICKCISYNLKKSQTREQLLVCFPFCLYSVEAEAEFPECGASGSHCPSPAPCIFLHVFSSLLSPASALAIPLRVLPSQVYLLPGTVAAQDLGFFNLYTCPPNKLDITFHF